MQTNGRFDVVNIDENKNRRRKIDEIIIRKEMKTKKRYSINKRREKKRNETKPNQIKCKRQSIDRSFEGQHTVHEDKFH